MKHLNVRSTFLNYGGCFLISSLLLLNKGGGVDIALFMMVSTFLIAYILILFIPLIVNIFLQKNILLRV